MKSDLDLVRRYLQGDESAFREFYARYRRPLFVYLLALVGHRDNAEDLLQETFFLFLRGVDRLGDRENLQPWLLRVARNAAIDFLRRKQRAEEARAHHRRDLLLRQSASQRQPTSGVDSERLARAVQSLPPDQREVVVLHGLLDVTLREIADLIEVSENTVASRFRYGREKLAVILRSESGATRRSQT
jgi:RNA polymerase sigma-70 factor (ECF subfamily)